MKLKPLITFIFFFITSVTGEAQIKKGNYFFNPVFSSTYQTEHARSLSNLPWSFRTGYSKMITDQLMIGGGIGFTDGSLQFITQDGSHRIKSRRYSFDANLRWYFTRQKWAFFAFVESNFMVNNYGKIILPSDHPDYDYLFDLYRSLVDKQGTRTEFGLGLDYFIKNNIIIESLLGLDVLRTGSIHQNRTSYKALNLTTSTKVYFGNHSKGELGAIRNQFLKEGNVTLNGGLLINYYFKDKYNRQFFVYPNISYFLNDKTKINASLNYSKNIFLKNTDSSVSISLGLKRYLKLSSDFLISIHSEIAVLNSKDSDSEIRITRFDMPINIDLNYFYKRSKYYLGASYHLSRYDYSEREAPGKKQQLSYHLSWDYFLSSNVFIQTNLRANHSSRYVFATDPLNPLTEKISHFFLRSSIYFILN